MGSTAHVTNLAAAYTENIELYHLQLMNTQKAACEVIRLPGRVDMIISPFFAEDLKQKIRPGITLILDMARTYFVDPAITVVFLDGIALCQTEGAKIVVQGMRPEVSEVFARAGLLPYFQ